MKRSEKPYDYFDRELGNQMLSTEPVYREFPRAQLTFAFELVRDPLNWKEPIDAIIWSDFERAVTCAIDFFAGGGATFEEIEGEPGLLRVKAPGYYVQIGA
jgi:hypothetical protein